jgi:hypothetical protein
VKDESARKTYSAEGIGEPVYLQCFSETKVGKLEDCAVVVEKD